MSSDSEPLFHYPHLMENYRLEALDKVGMKILKDNPEAVAVVFAELDCGCMKVIGASANGNPVGSRIMIAGVPPTNDTFFMCSKCIKDQGTDDRVVEYGIAWKKEKGKKPNEKYRNAIFQKAFGYDAPELDLENI